MGLFCFDIVGVAVINKATGLTLEDIETLSPRFWQLHRDPIICSDGAATTLLTIQLNLVIGTILDCVGVREDMRDLLDGLLSYRIS